MQPPRHYECRYVLTHGREYCAVDCPICSHAKSLFRVKEHMVSDSFAGSSPTVFVGRFGYPHVNMGIMAPPEIRGDAWSLDAPRYWAKQELAIPQLVDLRSSLINSRFRAPIKGSNRYLELGQEVAMAEKSADVEIDLHKKPSFRLNFQLEVPLSGPSASLKKARLTSNPHIPQKVEKIHADSDLLASPAITELYSRGFDENYLSGLLSAGVLGVKPQRKLVPTRWSITATDDTIGKQLISGIRDHQFGDHNVWFGGYLGNFFIVLSFPDVWRYELFELFVTPDRPRPVQDVPYTTDFEDYAGRKEYVEQTAGGYFAARLALLEELTRMKRQNSMLVLRFITDAYTVPLGVWVVREASRKSMGSTPLSFGSEELMLRYVEQFTRKKFGYDASYLFKRSKLMKEVRTQKKLTGYF